MNQSVTQKLNLVIVEDNLADFRLMELAFAEKQISKRLNIIHLKDGEEVLDFLSKIRNNQLVIDMILLDLHIPKLNGFDVLEDIRKNELQFETPIYVFSNSSNEADIQKCYELKASGYIQKPINIEDLFEITDFFVDILENKSENLSNKNQFVNKGSLFFA